MRQINCLLLLFLSPLCLLAQQKISGKVTDENAQPLRGANISIAGKTGVPLPMPMAFMKFLLRT